MNQSQRIIQGLREELLPAGTKVMVNPTPLDIRSSYPAADWIDAPVMVTLKDDAPNEGSLDVIDVFDSQGVERSIYDFNISQA